MNSLKKNAAVLQAVLAVTGVIWGVFSFVYVKWIVPAYAVTLVLLVAGIFSVNFLIERQKMRPAKAAAGKALLYTFIFGAVYFAASFVINNVIWKGMHSSYTVLIITVPFAVYLCVLYKKWANGYREKVNKKPFPVSPVIAVIAAVAITVATSSGASVKSVMLARYSVKEAAPITSVSYTKNKSLPVDDADFYISADGSDENPGTIDAPFATFDKAKEAVRAMDKTDRNGITVAVKGGEYRVTNILFSEEDGGTEQCPVKYCAYGDGEVVLNGGVTLDPALFKPVTDENMLSRLSEDAKKSVVCADIKSLGITPEQYGKIYAIGSYNTAAKYDGDYVGPIYCELFVNDIRMNIARYPDTGWLETDDVVEVGYGRESDGSLTAKENWDEVRNPSPDIYKVSSELASRIASWKTLDDVWVFGFWKYDWADASSPIGAFDADKKTLSPMFVSSFGAKKGAPYYFFNVFEELDAPGEWYLDRENGIVYLYPPADTSEAVIDLSLSTESVISVENAEYLTVCGFTVKGTRGDAVTVNGNDCTVTECLIKNIAGNAVVVNGNNCTVSDNEITRTGKGGIVIHGGDTATLTPGSNVAINNLVHDWSEIYMTYQPAVSLYGCGNICTHNEMYNSPHEAITYGGNNHDISYNLIHDVCLLTDDGGAIYSGRSWVNYGTQIRYNAVYDLGSGGHKPAGIYLDDALSGQTVYGNILINVPHIGIQLGGGRDLNVKNNIVINTNEEPFTYDQRAIDGVFGGWFTHSSQQGGDMWQAIYSSPWQSDAWKNAFPEMLRFSDNFDDTDNPNFVPNPAYSEVTGNVVINLFGYFGGISEKAEKYSNISGNAVFKPGKMADVFTDPANGDYTLKENSAALKLIPDFEQLPFDKIGRTS